MTRCFVTHTQKTHNIADSTTKDLPMSRSCGNRATGRRDGSVRGAFGNLHFLCHLLSNALCHFAHGERMTPRSLHFCMSLLLDAFIIIYHLSIHHLAYWDFFHLVR